MSVYPRNLSIFLNRLSGYNKNNVKLTVLGSDTANQGDIIQVDLPSNSIVDLSSLAWSFRVTYGTQVNGAAGAANLVPPLNCEGLISRLAVEVNGQTLVNLTNYNDLFHLLLNMTATEDYQRQRMVAQTNVSQKVAATAGGQTNGTAQSLVAADGIVDAAVVTRGAGTSASIRDHVVDTWVGFLGSAKPNFIDTSLLGNVRITITLAPGDILGGAAGVDEATVRTYAVSKQAFSIDVISIGDGIYDSMVDQMLASGRPIEIPFKNYFCYTSLQANMGQTTSFNVASQSIDRLWGTSKCNHGTIAYNLGTAPKIAVDDANPMILEHTAPYFNYQGHHGKHYQFQVNNTLYPNWISDNMADHFQHAKLALGDQGNMLSGSQPISAKMYGENFFAYVVSLEHHTDSDERFLSGIDTRGASANCYFKSVDAGVANPSSLVLVFAECTSSLKIMANKVLEIVQ
eukprot:SAG11_NODE_3135_length_2662_cov_11.875927_2_plen_458_part_00